MNGYLSQLFVDLSQRSSLQEPFADYNFRSWEKDQFMDWHTHEFLQIIHVLEGQLMVDYGKGWVTLKKGSLHILPPNKKHRLKTMTGHYQFGLNFRSGMPYPNLLSELLTELNEPKTINMRFKIEWKQKLIEQPRLATPLDVLKKIHTLEDYCFNILEHMTVSKEDPLGRKLIDFIEKNISKPVNVDEIAKVLNTSRATLHRVCKKIFGLGASQLFERTRLEKVAEKLMTTNDSVEKISQVMGFKDVSHLSKAFKKVYGVPPSKFRAEKY